MRKVSSLFGWLVVVGVLLFVFRAQIRDYYDNTRAIQKGAEQGEILIAEIDQLMRIIDEDVRTLNFVKLQKDLGLTKAKLNELIALSEDQKEALDDRAQKQIDNYKKAREAIELIQQGVVEKDYSKIGEGADLIKSLNLSFNE